MWREPDDRLVAYRLTTVTYGLNCASYLALRTVQQLVQDEGYRFPKAITPLKSRYVDDIFGGADSTEEMKEIIQLTLLCERIDFRYKNGVATFPKCYLRTSISHHLLLKSNLRSVRY